MSDNEIVNWFEKQAQSSRYIIIPQDVFDSITFEQSELIMRHFAHTALMLLPKREIEFFEWLKVHEESVWTDLWADAADEPYVVGVSFLSKLIKLPDRGFPICDLINNDNYYFSVSHMIDEEAKAFLESSRLRLLAKEKLTVAQLLAVEIAENPIDIWHFAYKYKLSISPVKQTVAQMVEDKVLIHFPDASHLANFIEW